MDSVTTALTDTLADGQALITGAVVVLLAIPATFVGIKIAKRVMNKA
jgi:hypothetical protein